MPNPTNITSDKKSLPPQQLPSRQRIRSLSAYVERPDEIRFETQESQEEVVLFLRQHFVVNSGWIVATILLLFIPQLTLNLLAANLLIPEGIPSAYFVILPLLWYVGIFGYAFVNFLFWYFNIYIVTNERVVDINWVNLLYKQISTAKLEKIEDVTSKQGGIIGTLFNYGNIHVQTAGEELNFDFTSVLNPNLIVKIINELIS